MTTAAEAIEARPTLEQLIEAYGEARQKHGHHTYAEPTASARRAILDRMAELERDAARWQFLEEEHQRIDRICALSWKASGDRHGSKWVNAQDIGRAVDVEIAAIQRLPSAPDAKEQA